MRAMTLIMLFAILSVPNANADVLYCYDENGTGFKRDKAMKAGKFKPEKFTIKVDFENNRIYAKWLHLTKDWAGSFKCWGVDIDLGKMSQDLKPLKQITCATEEGSIFILHKKTLKFTRAYAPLVNDDPTLHYGQCEKFE